MTGTLSPAISRLLAVAILFALLLLGYGAIVVPVTEAFSDRAAEIERLRETLVRYERVGGEFDRLRAEQDFLKRRMAAQRGFLQGSSDALVAATLLNRLKSIAERSGGELRSTQTLPSRAEGKFRRITVRAQVSGNVASLQKMVYAIESGMLELFIDNLTIQARSVRRRRQESESDAVLDVNLDVYGFLRGAVP